MKLGVGDVLRSGIPRTQSIVVVGIKIQAARPGSE